MPQPDIAIPSRAPADVSADDTIQPFEVSALDLRGLNVDPEAVRTLLSVDAAAWRDELPGIEKHFTIFGAKLPAGLRAELEALRQRLA